MGSLTANRMGRRQKLAVIPLPLDASQQAYIDGLAAGDTSTGGVKPGQASTTLIPLGRFASRVDNSAGTTQTTVLVALNQEIQGEWWDNDTGGNAVLAANRFSEVYVKDDHTVTLASSGNSKAGRVFDVDSVKGVLIVPSRLQY